MNSQETLATLDTQNKKEQHRKLKKMSNTDTTKKSRLDTGVCEW
jgi:hypothetical protein